MESAGGGFQVEVRGHHFEPSRELLDYAQKHAEKLGRYFEGLRRLEVVLKQDGRAGFQAELVAHVVRGRRLVAEASSPEAMTVAIDTVVDRMERQLVRLKERLRERRRHGT